MSGPAAPTTKMVDLAGKPAEVPNADVPQAFASRQFGFAKGSRVPIVTEDGEVGTVPAEDAYDAFQNGASVASPEQLRSAELEAHHGGVGGTLAAFGEGAARGATFGLSDPLAIGVADALGHGQDVRQHLAEEKETHPYAAFGGEAAGAIAPLFIPGAGEANAARVAGGFGEGAATAGRALGAIPRGVAALGQGAERLAAGVVGEGSDILAHRVAQSVVRKAAGAAVEGMAFGAGNEVSEAALGDHDLNAESLMAAMGHTALVGGVLGGAVGGVGALAGAAANAALRRLAPRLSEEAGEQAWKALDPLKKFSEQANARAGGTGEVGREMLRRGVFPTEGGLLSSALTPEDMVERIAAAKNAVGEEQGALLANSKGVVSHRELLDPIDDIIKREAAKAGHEHIVASLESYRDSLAEKLGLSRAADHSPGIEGAVESRVPGGAAANDTASELASAASHESTGATAYKPGGMASNDNAALPTRTVSVPGGAAANDNVAGAERLRKGVSAHIPGGLPSNDNAVDAFAKVHVPGGAAGNDNAFAHLPGGGIANDTAADLLATGKVHVPGGLAANENARAIPVQELVAQRRALDELVYKESKSLDPKMRIALLREYRSVMSAAETEAVDRAAKELGGPGGDKLRELNKAYQRLSIAQEAAEASTSRMATNRNLSASDYGAAIASAASGHPLAAPVLAIGHKFVRERGNAMAAVAFDKLSQLGMIQRASAQVDREITGAVGSYLKKTPGDARAEAAIANKKPALRVRTFGKKEPEPESPRKRYEARVDEVSHYASQPAVRAEQVSAHLGGLGSHAPATVASVSSVANRGTAFLQAKIPPRHVDMQSLTPHAERPRVSDTEMARFLRYADAVDDPLKIVDDMKSGRLTKETVEAVRAVYPKLYATIQGRVADELSDRTTKVPYEQRVRLGMLLGVPADKSMTPAFQKALQAAYGPPPPEPKPQAPSGKPITIGESFKTESQKIEGGQE